MIYTIGYEALTPEVLRDTAIGLAATVIDVRSRPTTRRRGFGRRQLEALLGTRYQWHGDALGGFALKEGIEYLPYPKKSGIKGASGTTMEGINFLRSFPGNVLLLCVEEAPGECHRHIVICEQFFPRARHIYRDEVVTACELEQAINWDRQHPNGPFAEYEYLPLGELVRKSA